MSFSLTVPRSETYEAFEDNVYAAKPSPKIDARTKIGRAQNALVSAGKGALCELASWAEYDGAIGGGIAGHVNDDLSGNVSVSLYLLAALPPEE